MSRVSHSRSLSSPGHSSTAFAAKVVNFEHLTLTGATTSTVDLAALGGYSFVTDKGVTALTQAGEMLVLIAVQAALEEAPPVAAA